jgi:catechol-2,3-dioxygenase
MRIIELYLQTTDLSRQRDFYQDALGLATRIEREELLVQAGVTRLVFTQASGGLGGVYHFAFNIPQNRFDEAKAWLSRRLPLIKNNTGMDSFAFENWNAHSLYFLDAAGNILEFIARHNMANDSNEPFRERSILSISEIGLASDDVEATVKMLQAGLGVGIYDGEGSDTFTAVGDEDGLLIVVKEWRIWFPDTGQPAKLLPVAVSVAKQAGEVPRIVGTPYRVVTE